MISLQLRPVTGKANTIAGLMQWHKVDDTRVIGEDTRSHRLALNTRHENSEEAKEGVGQVFLFLRAVAVEHNVRSTSVNSQSGLNQGALNTIHSSLHPQ